MHSLHLLLCWPLMGGIGPLPPLGLQGFAIAMVASRAFGVAFHLWLWRERLGLVAKRRDWWTLHWPRLAPVLHIGLPGAAENVAYRVALMQRSHRGTAGISLERLLGRFFVPLLPEKIGRAHV